MLFMNSPTGEAINTGLTFLQTIAPFYLLLAFKLTSDGLMRGCGMMGRFMATTLSDLFLRVVLAVLFSRWLGVNGIWLSWPVGWFVGTGFLHGVLSYLYLPAGRRKNDAVTFLTRVKAFISR